jgi:hypothetical protein
MKIGTRLISLLVCLLAVSACFAQGGGRRGQRGQRGPGTSITQLVRRPDVQAELAITDDQKTKLSTLFPRGARGAGGGGGAGGGQRTPPTPEEMAAREAEQDKQLATVLTPAQVTRLHEIQIQLLGIQAITRPEVQTKLELSPDQVAKIKELQKGYSDANASLRQKQQDQSITREDAQAARTKNMAALKDELTKVLTPAQADKLKTLGGKPFQASPPSGGG